MEVRKINEQLSAFFSNKIIFVLLSVLLCFISLFVFALLVNRQGFPFDDAWIHLVYARNLRLLHEWSFNPGIPSIGDSSPLWVIMIALTSVFLRNELVSVLFLSMLCFVVFVPSIASLLFKESPIKKFMLTMLLSTQPLLLTWSFSGMEVPFFLLLSSFLLHSLRSKNFGLCIMDP